MSLQKKLAEAALAAAKEAALNERARCLWCMDEIIRETREGLSKKLLSPAEMQGAEIKLKIAEALGTAMRRAIISGIRPPGGPGRSGAAVFQPTEG